MKKVFVITFLALFGISVSSFSLTGKKDNKLIAIWVYSGYEDELIQYVKSRRFKKDECGIKFKKNGKLIMRESVTWRSTPHMFYKNYKGSWEYTSDSTLTIKLNYEERKVQLCGEIVELNTNSLKIKRGCNTNQK